MIEKVVILDFGSQFTQLIARRVRELNIYCEIYPYHHALDLKDPSLKAVILSGSPASVRDENHPMIDLKALMESTPVLAICYGAQLLANQLDGMVSASSKREYGFSSLELIKDDPIWDNVENNSQVWMSHSDTISQLPDSAELLAVSQNKAIAAFKLNPVTHPVYAFQFHPEVVHTLFGKQLLSNFLLSILKIKAVWTESSYIDNTIQDIQEKVGQDNVLLAISGGVDSSVAALLMQRAIGDQLHCVFVDNGLLRKNEFETVLHTYSDLGLQIHGINAQLEFYDALKQISDPEQKRKIIGKTFIDVFEREAKKIGEVKWLCQGTIYPDVIESVSVYGPSVMIKSHHNVGGLPEKLNLKIIEPLRLLFKDEVRLVGKKLGLPSIILNRHPFPGPGLAIRIIGEITEENVQLLQDADEIYINILKQSDWYDKIWQAGTILLPIHTVGVMGDERTYEKVIALRAVTSHDGMTAEFSKLPHEILSKISGEIINNVKGINRVVYDISSKPPATIEWE
ncbi:MAG: glutamine-hydrolyzing GMP synthase [Bacteroidota bacterium]|nr:glutamine-hydrolyzing GMP synthase [Bacteroidota bacterium]